MRTETTGQSLKHTNFDRESWHNYVGDDKVITSHELQARLDAVKKSPYICVKTGINGIDAAIESAQDGELYIISGPTKNGKTLLAQTFTKNFSNAGEYCTWFSYEVPGRQFLSQFPLLPMFYLPQKNKAQDFTWFMERCIESFIKYNSRIIFIDHLHYLIDMARVKNPSLDIGTIVRRIKRFAVDNDFVIFLLCHIGKNEAEQLSYRDLRDSSFIAQESDCVIMVKRTPDKGINTARSRVEFHRRTGVIEKIVDLVKVDGLLREQAPI